MVHPTARQRGLGTSLWNEVEARLRALDVRHVTSIGSDSDGSCRFMAARGFEVTFVERSNLGLDPRMLPAGPAPPEGVELRPFAKIDDPHVVFELDVEALRDVPTDQPLDDIRFDEWLERDLALPRHGSGWKPACARRRSASRMRSTFLISPETLLAVSGMTGVARRFRGRGLSELLKRHALAHAAARGVTMALTDNDETNAPMLAVNDKLGYLPVASRLVFSRRHTN